MRIDIEIAARAIPPPVWCWFFKLCLEGMVLVNRAAMRVNRIPRLYSSGVRYQEEPLGTETLRDALTTLDIGHGDCAHLGAWRVAELQEQGETASIRITATPSIYRPNTTIFHVLARRGSKLVDNDGFAAMLAKGFIKYEDGGFIEDPSKVLGMGQLG